MAMYESFAALYDRLMDDFDYPEWADYYLRLLDRAGVRLRTLCDCACGTGSMTVQFATRDLRVTGVDIAQDMLEIAAVKARREGVKAMFVCQDMCALELPRPVDALVCACDGVNYLLTEERLKEFFRAAFRSIKPGGALAFDISSRYKLEETMGDAFFGEERDDVAYLWANSLDKEKHIVTMDITFFAREDEDAELYRRFTEKHVQRAHDAHEIAGLLEECGFTQIEIFGDRTFEAPAADEKRIHFLARRAK